MVYSTRRFVVCLSMCHFVLVFFFSPFSIAITSLGEERANLSAFRTFVRFVLVWICRFPLPLGVWEGLRFVIVGLPGLFSYLFLDVTYSPRGLAVHMQIFKTKKYHILGYKVKILGADLRPLVHTCPYVSSGYNVFVQVLPPSTPLLYSKTGVYRGIHYFSYFTK